MNKEKYAIDNDQIVIEDKDLQIAIKAPFNPERLPENPLDGQQLKKGDVVRVKMLSEDGQKEAYIENKGQQNGQYCLYYPNGALKGEMYYLKGRLHGPSTFFSEDGKTLAKSWFVNGLQQGKVKQYYLSGSPYSVQGFVEGVLDGRQEYYYENGTPKTIMHYSKGKLHGETKLFFVDGSLKREIHFKDGMKNGPERHWNEGKVLVLEAMFRNDVIVEARDIHV